MSSRMQPLDLMDPTSTYREEKKLYLKAMAVRRKIKKTNYWTSSWKPVFVISQVFFESSVYLPACSFTLYYQSFVPVYLVSAQGVPTGRI